MREPSSCGVHIMGHRTGTLCHWCSFTRVIPNLQDPRNQFAWAEIEQAKRRLLLQLALLELPPYRSDVPLDIPLTFEFKEDEVDANGDTQPVYTGHHQGVITMNIREADSVYREATRIALGEPQRTLIGHLRHEVGHYIDYILAWPTASDEYRSIFGDPLAIDYNQAKEQHYLRGARNDWAAEFVSPYASMHPWEDFAETLATYLDLMAIAVTANDQGLRSIDIRPASSIEEIVKQTLSIAVLVSEFNLDLGLPPCFLKTLPGPWSTRWRTSIGFEGVNRVGFEDKLAGTSPFES